MILTSIIIACLVVWFSTRAVLIFFIPKTQIILFQELKKKKIKNRSIIIGTKYAIDPVIKNNCVCVELHNYLFLRQLFYLSLIKKSFLMKKEYLLEAYLQTNNQLRNEEDREIILAYVFEIVLNDNTHYIDNLINKALKIEKLKCLL